MKPFRQNKPSWITHSGGKPVSHQKLRTVVFLKAFQQWGKKQSKCISRGGYSHLPPTLFLAIKANSAWAKQIKLEWAGLIRKQNSNGKSCCVFFFFSPGIFSSVSGHLQNPNKALKNPYHGMTSPCLSLSNEPIFFFLEDKTTFDYEKYRRKFSIICIGQLEYRGRKLQYSSDTKLWNISFPDALLHSLFRFQHFKGSFWNCQKIRKVSEWSSLISQIKEGMDHRGGGERGMKEEKNGNKFFLF